MQVLTAGSLRVRAVGGTDGNAGGDGPAIILSHGFGAPGDDLVSLARVVDAGRGVRWFFPEAPHALDVGMGQQGRAWWHIDMMRFQREMMAGRRANIVDETPDGLVEARAALDGCIDALVAEHRLDPARTILGGFSQGAMLSTELVLFREKTSFAGLAVLSGSLLSSSRWSPAIAERGASLHVMQSHGEADPILAFEGAMALRNLLVAAGADVDFVKFRGQHEIPSVTLEHLAAFARARLA